MSSPLPLVMRAVLTGLDGTGLSVQGPVEQGALACSTVPDLLRLEMRLQRTSRGDVHRLPVSGPTGAGWLVAGLLPYARRGHLDETLAELGSALEDPAPMDLGSTTAEQVHPRDLPGTLAYTARLTVSGQPVTSERLYLRRGSRLLALGSRTEGDVPAVPLSLLLGAVPLVLAGR